jgi:hypothetical protein
MTLPDLERVLAVACMTVVLLIALLSIWGAVDGFTALRIYGSLGLLGLGYVFVKSVLGASSQDCVGSVATQGGGPAQRGQGRRFES